MIVLCCVKYFIFLFYIVEIKLDKNWRYKETQIVKYYLVSFFSCNSFFLFLYYHPIFGNDINCISMYIQFTLSLFNSFSFSFSLSFILVLQLIVSYYHFVIFLLKSCNNYCCFLFFVFFFN